MPTVSPGCRGGIYATILRVESGPSRGRHVFLRGTSIDDITGQMNKLGLRHGVSDVPHASNYSVVAHYDGIGICAYETVKTRYDLLRSGLLSNEEARGSMDLVVRERKKWASSSPLRSSQSRSLVSHT